MQNSILITGVTGFLGSHVARQLSNKNYLIIATKRSGSNLKNCDNFPNKVAWINTDEDNWKEKASSYKPQIIIHAAWMGVEAGERNDWEKQVENLGFLSDLLDIALDSETKKIIGLGSQAEYGFIDTCVSEQHPLNATSAYGAVKIIASQIIRKFCFQHNIQWCWLRIFSVFGENESDQWLITSVIKKIQKGLVNEMEFSGCEQAYAYLYIKDFVSAVESVVEKKENINGFFNVSASEAAQLKKIITYIRDVINPSFNLKFGALPYRPNQPMLIQGDSSNFITSFGNFEHTSLWHGLNMVITFNKEQSLL